MRKLMARLTAHTRNDRGVALFAAIAGMVLLSSMIAALVILARNEGLIAQLNKDEAQAAYAAEAGANWGRRVLLQRLSVDLPAAVVATPRPAMRTALMTTYNSANGGAQFIRDFAIPTSGPTFAACTDCVEPNYSAVGNIPDAQQTVLAITCPGTPGCPANLNFTTRVIVGTHPTIPPAITNGGNGALFTYVWRIESSGTSGRARQQWVIHDSSVPTNTVGSFTIALNAEFVKYAHFIDQFQDAGNGEPWISYRHEYTGPVHTNRRFSILGNIGTAGQEGPTFRSAATQTMSTTRFNNAGSNTNLSRDSSANDWPLLGPTPGILCKQVDCSGFTRSFDFDPLTPAIDPIPFPGGNNPQDRITQMCLALGIATAACPVAPAPPPTLTTVGCATAPAVFVGRQCGGDGLLNGGIFVTGNVRDLQLAHTNVGQSIVIQTSSSKRTLIVEDVNAGTVTVTRQCLKTGTPPSDAQVTCNGGAGATWWQDQTLGPGWQQQVLTGLFSPDPATDRGMIFVYDGDIGQVGTSNGLRRGTYNTADIHAVGWVDTAFAIYQNTVDATRGMRLTVAADGNVWITGPLNYRVDPRGADGFFSDPIPGDATGTSADDQMDVQNVLGVLSWATPAPTVPVSRSGGVRLSSVLTGDLATHGMVFAANLSNQAEPSGQFSFDDPNGVYRGISQVVGGVVQKTMGTFGQPSSNLGYARDWIYDERFRYRALSPPAFPGFPNFTAATSLGIDSYTWRLGLF
jgi:hypothetical protein